MIILKKTLTILISILLIIPFSINSHASSECHWYIKRNGNLRPAFPNEADEVKKHGGYFIDEHLTDNSSDKRLYLTFDAGYENGNVEIILDTLKAEKIPAAFFLLDNIIINNKDLVIRMLNEGHLVCNHTSKHLDVTKCETVDEFRTELERLENVFKECTGVEMPKYFRAPEGKFSESSMKFASQLGYKTIFWSFAYADWDNDKQMSASAAKEKIMSNIHNGEIMLLHPTSKTNAEILSDIICELKAQGYRFGTLDELVGA
jgi:peptidoglycan-N-acetylmuramic acid deacetylase